MPLTAVFDDRHVLDATAPDLGGAVAWTAIYRARPRAPLRCRGCRGQMQARQSVLSQRFFRHDAAVPDCPTAGETPAHRELKNELAAAIRAAGWTAELEVAGTGWRADVLAVSPDGHRRIAWEAQLASTTADGLRERTATMRRELDGVCWVTEKDVPWVGEVPGIRLMRSPERTVVVDGIAKFEPAWCRDRAHCEIWEQHGWYGRPVEPCPGHGSWRIPDGFELVDFVAAVCSDRLVVHRAVADLVRVGPRHRPGRTIWTARKYITAEAEQVRTTESQERREAAHARQREEHHQRIEDLLIRQTALTRPAVEFVYGKFGVYPESSGGPPDPRWAMGVPVVVDGATRAVVCPVANRIDSSIGKKLAAAVVLVASERERARVAAQCVPGQQVVVIPIGDVELANVREARRKASEGVAIRDLARRMVWGR